MAANTLLTDLQSAIATRLALHSVFVGPPVIGVISELHGDLGKQIDINLAKLGLAVVVGTPLVVGGAFPEIEVNGVVMITEQPVVNRAKGLVASAMDIGISAMEQLWTWQPSAVWSPIDEPRMKLVDTEPIIYEVSFKVVSVIKI